MSVGNPQNEWEQGMLDATNEIIIDPLIESCAKELGISKFSINKGEQNEENN